MTAHSETPHLPFSQDPPKSRADAEAFCSALIQTMERLLAAIEQETDLVRSGHLKAAGLLQPEKAKLIHEYTRGMIAANENAIALGNLSPDATKKLRRQHAEFQPVLRINLAVLATAKEVAGNIVSTVAKSVGAKQKSNTYGSSGQAPQGAATAQGIALNRSL